MLLNAPAECLLAQERCKSTFEVHSEYAGVNFGSRLPNIQARISRVPVKISRRSLRSSSRDVVSQLMKGSGNLSANSSDTHCVSGLWPLGQGPEDSWGSVFVDHQADPRLQWTHQGYGEGIYSTTGVKLEMFEKSEVINRKRVRRIKVKERVAENELDGRKWKA